jgi:cytoskeletal protein CcmA (bactofilin family)
MSTTIQPPRPPIPSRPREPIGNRPLPKGIVAVAHSQPAPGPAVPDRAPEGTLIVGRDIQVKGQIDDCRALVVEGRVEATLKTDRLEVRKGGIFVGSAEVGHARIAGTFEGDLNVTGQLDVAAGGLVRGETCYTRITIEAGGAIVGTVGRAGDAENQSQRPSLAETGS